MKCGLIAGFTLIAFAGPLGADSAKRIEPNWEELSRLPIIKLNPPPAWVGSGGRWSIDEIEGEFQKVTDRMPAINSDRDSFLRADHQWLIAFTTWFIHLQKTLKLEYKDQVWDCDDYARSFVAFADMVATSGGQAKGSLCAGWATVFNRYSFGGVERSNMGGHAVVIVGTSEGLFVVEPQSGKMAPLRSYPNRHEFEDVNL